MSEPDTLAKSIESIAPGILHWSLLDNRIHNRSDSYAIETPEGKVLIDPLPLEDHLESQLEDAEAICLTGRFHQRAAWRYQKQFDVPVYAPRKGEGYEGTPDHLYDAEDLLPGGLKVVHTPGPSDAHFAFYLDRENGSAMFIGDLLTRRSGGEHFRFVPSEYQVAPDKTRESVRNLLEFSIDYLCPNHGAIQAGEVQEVLQEALDKDSGP